MSKPCDAVEADPRSTRQFLLIWLALTVVVVLAHFVFFPRMGLYEDDHWHIGVPMCQWHGVEDLLKSLKEVFGTFSFGRPLHFAFCKIFTFTGTHVAGLAGAYVIAMAIWVLNIGLCLTLLWRKFGATTATVATLFFVLFPADTTHPMLHVVFGVQPSVTFLLLSGIAYSRGRFVLSVLLAGLTLLTYETCFLPALAWPILFASETRPLWRRCLTHGLAMAAVLILAVAVRVQIGEARASSVFKDRQAIVTKVQQLALVGPSASFMTFVDRPVWVVKAWLSHEAFPGRGPSRKKVTAMMAAAGLAALLALVIARRRYGLPGDSKDANSPPPDSGAQQFIRLVIAGIGMVVLSYIVALNREPATVIGRMSSVHIAATLGWGILFSGVAAGVGQLLSRARAGWALVPVLAAYLSLLVGFHLFVQREHIRAWAAQREFWSDVIAECPDVQDGTIILFPLIRPTSHIVHNQEWADHFVFRNLFMCPSTWAAPPRAFPVGHLCWGGLPQEYRGYNWPDEVEREGDRLYWKHWDGTRVHLPPGNVILLRETPTHRFERMTGTVRMANLDLPLKPREGPTFGFKPNRLYREMFPKGLRRESSRTVSR